MSDVVVGQPFVLYLDEKMRPVDKAMAKYARVTWPSGESTLGVVGGDKSRDIVATKSDGEANEEVFYSTAQRKWFFSVGPGANGGSGGKEKDYKGKGEGKKLKGDKGKEVSKEKDSKVKGGTVKVNGLDVDAKEGKIWYSKTGDTDPYKDFSNEEDAFHGTYTGEVFGVNGDKFVNTGDEMFWTGNDHAVANVSVGGLLDKEGNKYPKGSTAEVSAGYLVDFIDELQENNPDYSGLEDLEITPEVSIEIPVDSKTKDSVVTPQQPHNEPVITKADLKKSEDDFKEFDHGQKSGYGSNAAQAQASFQPAFKEWNQSLTGKELNAIKSYTNGGYSEINIMLRSGDFDPEAHPHSDVTKAVKGIDSAMAKSPGLHQDVMLFRGFGNADIHNMVKGGKLKPGDVLTDDAYASTSTKEKLSTENFGDKPYSVVYRIKAEKGASGSYLSFSNTTSYMNESEFLLPRGTGLIVTGSHMQKIGGKNVAVVELLHKGK